MGHTCHLLPAAHDAVHHLHSVAACLVLLLQILVLGWCKSQRDMEVVRKVVQQVCVAHAAEDGTTVGMRAALCQDCVRTWHHTDECGVQEALGAKLRSKFLQDQQHCCFDLCVCVCFLSA